MLVVVLLLLLGPLARLLGGGLFNPCDAAVRWAQGALGTRAALVRSAAQAAGAVGGAAAARALVPPAWYGGEALVATLRPGADLVTGAGAEFMLTLLCTLAALAVDDLFSSTFVRQALPLAAVVFALQAGARYSGPILNPAVASSWSAISMRTPLTVVEHATVFWAAPLAAALLAAYAHAGWQASRRAPAAARAKAD
jgi:glycerol uptake facilitator-like aquaporin